jgi:hypothetical protein
VTGRFARIFHAAAFFPIAIVVLTAGCNHQRATPGDSTAISNEVSQTLVGKQITIRGKFASLVKADPCVVLDNQQEVWIGPRETALEETYSRMDGKLVEATGILRFSRHPSPADESRPLAVQREPDHYYFETATTQLRIVSR